jgi:hypothetical protein
MCSAPQGRRARKLRLRIAAINAGMYRRLQSDRRYKEARNSYRQLLDEFPFELTALLGLGHLLRLRHERDLASKNPRLGQCRAIWHEMLGCLVRASHAAPTNPAPRLMIARALCAQVCRSEQPRAFPSARCLEHETLVTRSTHDPHSSTPSPSSSSSSSSSAFSSSSSSSSATAASSATTTTSSTPPSASTAAAVLPPPPVGSSSHTHLRKCAHSHAPHSADSAFSLSSPAVHLSSTPSTAAAAATALAPWLAENNPLSSSSGSGSSTSNPPPGSDTPAYLLHLAGAHVHHVLAEEPDHRVALQTSVRVRVLSALLTEPTPTPTHWLCTLSAVLTALEQVYALCPDHALVSAALGAAALAQHLSGGRNSAGRGERGEALASPSLPSSSDQQHTETGEQRAAEMLVRAQALLPPSQFHRPLIELLASASTTSTTVTRPLALTGSTSGARGSSSTDTRSRTASTSKTNNMDDTISVSSMRLDVDLASALFVQLYLAEAPDSLKKRAHQRLHTLLRSH